MLSFETGSARRARRPRLDVMLLWCCAGAGAGAVAEGEIICTSTNQN